LAVRAAVQKVQSVLVRLGAGIERKAVRLQLRLIIGDLVAGHAGRESVQAQDVVPDEIVFLTPRARLSEGETGKMPPSAGRLHPMLCIDLWPDRKYLLAVAHRRRRWQRSP